MLQTAWLCLWLSLEATWLALFGINGVRNKRSHLVGTPISSVQARPVFQVGISQET